MKINKLNHFEFYIGNTEDELSVVATNNGIFIDGELDGTYNDEDIESAYDLSDAIDTAISDCPTLSPIDKEELGCWLGAETDIKDWWDKNYA